MYSTAIGLLALSGDHRKLFEIVPEHVKNLLNEWTLERLIPEDLKNLWNEWVLEVLILISVASQIVLLLLGNLRKHIPRTRIRIAIWCAYILSNAVASAYLSILSRGSLDVCSNSHPNSQHKSELMSFWAPFLLLHLGGPDTITAYSLEDNELWLRNLAELGFQSGVAVYILLLSLPGISDHLPLLSISIYLAGLIKCFERVQALRLANTENLRESMLGSPDPGPNYPKFLEEFQLRKSEGFSVTLEEVPETSLPHHAYPASRSKVISEAYDLFQKFKRIFVDLIVISEDRKISQAYFQHLEYGEAFTTIEIELGFAYDMLYTKAYVVYTFIGAFLRLTSVLLVVMALVGFCFLCDTDHYRVIDIVITYILISTAVMMEIFAVVTLLRSDWTDHWLSQHNNTRNMLIFPFLKKPTKLRWSGSIAQLDLISVALEEKPASLLHIQKFFGIDKYRVKHRYRTYSNVSDNLKSLIYKQFLEFIKVNSDPMALCSHKCSFSLRENNCDTLLWSISKVDFDQSILIWHIATTLCYYSDLESDKDHTDINVCRVESKHLSEYLLHLLVAYPVMLPIRIGMIRYRDTCADAMRFFKDKGPINGKVEACQELLQLDCTQVLPNVVKGDRSKSTLFDGCILASSLKKMKREDMWKITCQVWIEMLAYAAIQCRGVHHEQQLGKGGEFLTHVWLLMAHLGITE